MIVQWINMKQFDIHHSNEEEEVELIREYLYNMANTTAKPMTMTLSEVDNMM